jgi:hypothetical protein
MVKRRKKSAEERTIPLYGLLPGDVLLVAAAAGVDPRTVRAVVDGRGSKMSRTVVVDAMRGLIGAGDIEHRRRFRVAITNLGEEVVTRG